MVMGIETLSHHCFGVPSAPTLLLLHGFLGDYRDWQGIIFLLQQDFFIIAVDLPAHGTSTWQHSDNAVDLFCQRLEATLTSIEQHDAKPLNPLYLLGYSLGARLAIAYTLAQPQRIQQLWLEGANFGLTNDDNRLIRIDNDQRWANRFSQEPMAEVLNDWYQQPVFADLSAAEREQLVALRSQQMDRIALSQAMVAFSLGKQPDYRALLKAAHDHVAFICGAQDKKFRAIGEQLAADAVVQQLHIVPMSGHNVHRAQPAAFAALLRCLAGVRHE